MSKTLDLHLPLRPYGIIAGINRMALATGSIARAMAGASADYNGHLVSVYFNDYRSYYVADYTWSGRQVLARGGVEECLRAAIREYDRGALGASVSVSLRPEDVTLVTSSTLSRFATGALPERVWPWYHKHLGECLRSRNDHLLIEIDALDLTDEQKDERLYALRAGRRIA